MSQAGRLRVLLHSNVVKIEAQSVIVDVNGELHKIRNDAVIISAGGILPTTFLRSIGINVETKWGTE